MTALLASSPTCYVSSLAEYSADGRWILARSPGAFLLTDIEGSSLLWQRSPGSMAAALARHDLLITKLVTDSAGRIIKHTGDGFFAFFDGGNPLGCALEIQKAMASEDWGDLGALPVRIAVHAGSAERRGDDLFGIDVNFTSRLLSAAWGGQILASAEAAGSLPLPADASFLDLGVHMLRSFETPRPLLQLCHPGLPRNDFPPPNTQGGRSSNLPHPGSPLVGREGELEKLCLMLSDPSTRLVSIVGPGGMGKTRLAQQVALEILPEFAQGACYVPLAPLDTPELISAAIAESLGMRFHGPEDPLTLLTRYLRDREVLIVLDNFEHLIGGSATVGTILSSAPLPKILVTSRERLNLPGEYVFELSGLEYPAGGLPADTTELGAVRLFLDRAAALLPGYRPSGEDLEAVAMLTAVLRGMPLAIELAAGWVRMLSPSEILEETGKSLDFLESSSRGIPERHRSLRAIFAYSWALLTGDEQRLLPRLSVFRGEFDRHSASSISGAALPVLMGLLDKSLLQSRSPGEFEMLEVIRQYAEEKLRLDGRDAAAVLDAHSRYFLSWIDGTRVNVPGRHRSAAVKTIRKSWDDVRAAWKRAMRAGLLDEAMAAGSALFGYLDETCNYVEGEECFRELVELAGGDRQAPDAAAGRALVWHGWMLYRRARYTEAGNVLDRAAELLRPRGPSVDLFSAIAGRALVHYSVGGIEAIAEAFGECARISGATGDLPSIADAHTGLGLARSLSEDHEGARQHFRKALSIWERLEDGENQPLSYSNLAFSEMALGNFEEAERLIRTCLRIVSEQGNLFGLGSSMRALGTMAADRKRWVEAEDYFTRSLELYRRIGYDLGVAMSQCGLGELYLEAGDWLKARDYSSSVAASARASECQLYLAENLTIQGRADMELGSMDAAEDCLREATELSISKGDMTSLGRALYHVAELRGRQGRSDIRGGILAWLASDSATIQDIRARSRQELEAMGDASGGHARLWAGLTLTEMMTRIW